MDKEDQSYQSQSPIDKNNFQSNGENNTIDASGDHNIKIDFNSCKFEIKIDCNDVLSKLLALMPHKYLLVVTQYSFLSRLRIDPTIHHYPNLKDLKNKEKSLEINNWLNDDILDLCMEAFHKAHLGKGSKNAFFWLSFSDN